MNALSFSKLSLAALAVSLIAHAYQAFGHPPFYTIIIVNIVCLWFLTACANAYSRDRREDFDAVIAAETIVAFGVMSLILGLATAIFPIAMGEQVIGAANIGQLANLAWPFLEGLVTAGLAPFFAVVLRNLAYEHERHVDAAGDMADLARATGDLIRQLRAAKAQLEALEASAQKAVISTSGLADGLQVETARLETVLHAGQAHLGAFGTAAGASAGEIAKLTDEARRMNDSASDATTMLDALGNLIDSIQRFVAPARPSSKK